VCVNTDGIAGGSNIKDVLKGMLHGMDISSSVIITVHSAAF